MEPGGTVERWGAPELRPLIMPPGLDVRARSRERPITPPPRRAQGGLTYGARPALIICSGGLQPGSVNHAA